MNYFTPQLDLFAGQSATAAIIVDEAHGTWTDSQPHHGDVHAMHAWLLTLPPMPATVPPLAARIFELFFDGYADAAAHEAAHVNAPDFDDDTALRFYHFLQTFFNRAVDADPDKAVEYFQLVDADPRYQSVRVVRHRMMAGSYSAGIVFEGYAGLAVYVWENNNTRIEVMPCTDTFFRKHYDDDAPVLYLTSEAVAGTYSCQKLAESREKVPTIKPIAHEGRLYVALGMSYCRGLQFTDTYELVAEGDWHSDVHTHQTVLGAYDAGTRQRGDQRGILVIANGQRCVAAKYTLIITPATFTDHAAADDAEVKSDPIDDDLEEDTTHGECAEAA